MSGLEILGGIAAGSQLAGALHKQITQLLDIPGEVHSLCEQINGVAAVLRDVEKDRNVAKLPAYEALQRELQHAEKLVGDTTSKHALVKFLLSGVLLSALRAAASNISKRLQELHAVLALLQLKELSARLDNMKLDMLASFDARVRELWTDVEGSALEQPRVAKAALAGVLLQQGVLPMNDTEWDQALRDLDGAIRSRKGDRKVTVPLKRFSKVLHAVRESSTDTAPGHKPGDSAASPSLHVPDAFICPITLTIMRDPVNLEAEDVPYCYERQAAEEWLMRRGKSISPLTGRPLPRKDMVPNRTVKLMIDEWLDAKGLSHEDVDAALSGKPAAAAAAGSSCTPVTSPAKAQLAHRPYRVPNQRRASEANQSSTYEQEALLAACKKLSAITEVQRLLSHGVDPNYQEKQSGCTPLHYASDVYTANALLRKGAGVNATDKAGRTPLHLAADMGRAEVARLLLMRGADPRALTTTNKTVLHCTSAASLVELLIQSGVPLDARDKDGRTALHVAALHGRLAVVRQLIQSDTQRRLINTSDTSGCSPLHLATDPPIVQELCSAGAKLDAVDKDRRTPLHLASLHNRPEVVAELLRQGASPDAEDREGRIPRELASTASDMREVRELLTLALEEELLTACDKPTEDFVRVERLLVRHTVNSRTARPRDGVTPLHIASSRGHAQIAALLLKRGAAVSAEDLDKQTPLHKAKTANVARVLLEQNASVRSLDKVRRTPLHEASRHLRWEVVEALLARGADRAAKDQDGKTPGELAKEAWRASKPKLFNRSPAKTVGCEELSASEYDKLKTALKPSTR